jgi:hypothetical protein
MWGLWWTNRHWGKFSLSTSVSPASHHSTNFSIIIITRGWHNRPISGRSAEWTLDSTPPIYQLKKILGASTACNRDIFTFTFFIIIIMENFKLSSEQINSQLLLIQSFGRNENTLKPIKQKRKLFSKTPDP